MATTETGDSANQGSAYPLDGLRVLDFSRVLAGPFAGRMLSDLGAEVVKVEPPDGDLTRRWGRVIGGVPGYYHQQNAGKRNISIDLRAPGARELVLALVGEADILIENYRPDVMPKLGIGYEDLRKVNPRLIMLSISGFGSGGPESARPAYAPIIHAEVGLLDRQSRRGGVPMRDLPLSVADTNAALHGLVALLAAVIHRQHTGLGQHIDLAMIDATVSADDFALFGLEDSEATAPTPHDIWETGAGPILIATDVRHLWRMAVECFELDDETAEDADLELKIQRRRAAISRFLKSLPTWEDVERAMAEMNIAWGQVRHAATLSQQPTVQARGAIVQIDDRAGGTRPVTQSPYRFSNAASGVRGPAPHLGEHNRVVLRSWLGMEDGSIDALYETGVLQQQLQLAE